MTVPAVARNNDKDALTFDEAMGIIGTGYFQIKLAIIGGLVILSSYCAVGVITFVLPVAHCDLNIGYEDRGNLASISFVGLIISCHMWGFLSDTLGRRYILIRCLICDAILYFITMMTPNFYVFFFVRFFNGVASCGGVVSIYAYIGEFQTDKFRSRALMISSFIAACAYIMLPSLAWLIIPGTWQFNLYPGLIFKSWRLFYGVCGIPSLLSAILLFFLPESPKFLLAKGKNEKVVEILRKMYKANHKKDGELMIKNISMNNVERIAKLDDNKNKVLAVCQLLWNQTAPLLKKPHRYNFALLCTALFVCYFCNNGMYVWLPEAINRISLYKNFTGNDEGTFCDILDCDNKYELSKQMAMVKMFSYSNVENNITAIEKVLSDIDEPICYDEIDPTLYLTYILFGATTLIVWIIIAATIKYINKKYFILILTTLNLLATISMKWSSLLIFVPIKACAIMLFICGIFPILNSIVVDLFPTNLRAMAGCLTLMASRLGSVVTHEVTGFIIQSHCSLLIWNYIVLAAVCLIAVILLPTSPKLPSQSSSSSSSTLNIEEQERRNEEV